MLGVFEALCGGPWIQLYTIEDVYVKRAFAIDPPREFSAHFPIESESTVATYNGFFLFTFQLMICDD